MKAVFKPIKRPFCKTNRVHRSTKHQTAWHSRCIITACCVWRAAYLPIHTC